MTSWDLAEVVKRYNDHWPSRPGLLYDNNWIVGSFCIGNDYRNKVDYYGAYPGNLLERYNIMFGLPSEDIKVLHLFSGAIPSGPYIRVDIQQECDIPGDCQYLESFLPMSKYDIVFADPPYTKSDANKYGTAMPNRLKVMRSIPHTIKPGGLLVWLDIMKPMYRKENWKQVGLIGLERSTNHRIRGIWIFECKGKSQRLEEFV